MHLGSNRYGFVAAALLACVPTMAFAAPWRMAESKGLMTSAGEYFLVGAGATKFTDTGVKDLYDTSPAWEGRLGFGSRSFLGLEVAYVGAKHGASIGNNDVMMNGAEGTLRLQYPVVSGEWLVEPFAHGGVGWSHVSIDNLPAGVKDSDEIGVIPFGGGVTLGYNHFLIDARFTYRATFSDDLVPGRKLQNWAVLGSVGYEF